MAGGAIYTKREFASSDVIAGALTRSGAGVVWLVFCVIAFDGILRNGCLPLRAERRVSVRVYPIRVFCWNVAA